MRDRDPIPERDIVNAAVYTFLHDDCLKSHSPGSKHALKDIFGISRARCPKSSANHCDPDDHSHRSKAIV